MTYHVVMHIDAVPNRGSRPTYLLRESYREGARVRKRTLANLSALSDAQIHAIRAVLGGEQLGPVAEHFAVLASRPHGAVQAVRVAMQRLGFEALVGARRSPMRTLVCAMVAARIVAPHTKLGTTRWWHSSTLAEEFAVTEADADDLYAAMDWLLERQEPIQKKLAARHLRAGGLVLYDLSSSYFEGSCCPLAKIGYNRDGKRGMLQVNYGLATDARGCPVAVSVHEGNVADSQTLLPEIKRLRGQCGISELVMVGDRGMVSAENIAFLKRSGRRYIVGTPKSMLRQFERELLAEDWRTIREGLEVKICPSPDGGKETYILCRSRDRREKEKAMHERFSARMPNGDTTSGVRIRASTASPTSRRRGRGSWRASSSSRASCMSPGWASTRSSP